MPSERIRAEDIFQCTRCGKCCQGFGGTYVTREDIERIAAHIGADPRDFVADYCQMSGSRPVLAQGEDGYCVFWREVCTIHPVKPKMCKAWPFIESVLVDVENWRIMAGSCPGMRADAPPVLVKACVQQELAKTRGRGQAKS